MDSSPHDSYSLVLGRARARVERSWTQGAYSRHVDGRALLSWGIRTPYVDVAGALWQTCIEMELVEWDYENLRYLLTAHLPSPFNTDRSFGLERWNDLPTTTKEDAANLLFLTQADYLRCGIVQSRFPFAPIAA